MLFYVVSFLLPFIALVFMTVQLMRALQESRRKHQTMTRRKREENDITLMLLCVVAIFMVCQIGIPIRRLIVATVEETHQGILNCIIAKNRAPTESGKSGTGREF